MPLYIYIHTYIYIYYFCILLVFYFCIVFVFLFLGLGFPYKPPYNQKGHAPFFSQVTPGFEVVACPQAKLPVDPSAQARVDPNGCCSLPWRGKEP